jgi:hypothetical protein
MRDYEDAIMNRRVGLFLLGVLCCVASLTAVAQSAPVVVGTVNGTEWCLQEWPWCGDRAWFAGKFVGQVGNFKHTSGAFTAGVHHDSLNTSQEGAPTNITEGVWYLVIKQGNNTVAGTVAGGTLTYHTNNTFDIVLTMNVTQSSIGTASGTAYFKGTLDHNDLPPTVIGTICQSPCP